jgi:hypothetical protein
MNVIRPNCRVQFTAEDIDFIVSVLRPKVNDAETLVRLLSDQEARDLILDDESLLRAVLESRGCLRLSTHFYFYVLVRHVFRRAGLADREVADYVAEVLAEYSRAEQMECKIKGQPRSLNYFFEMLAALQTADDATGFYIRAHIGNYSLFFSGIFPDRIRFRAELRGAPDLRYYEALGKSSFRVASDHRLARKYDLAKVFDVLAERFEVTRLALNDLGERLITLGDPDAGLDSLLTSALKIGN